MGDQGLDVDQASCDQANGLRVLDRIFRDMYCVSNSKTSYLVAVSVLELQVNLVGTQVHERELVG